MTIQAIAKLVYELLEDDLKAHGFNIRKGNYRYKLEEGMLYRFGVGKSGMICEILPFCGPMKLSEDVQDPFRAVIPNVQLSDESMRIHHPDFVMIFSNPMGLPEDSEEFIELKKTSIINLYKNYVLPYIENVKTLYDLEKHIAKPIKDWNRGYMEGTRIPNFFSVNPMNGLIELYIYTKQYDKLMSYVLGYFVFEYEKKLCEIAAQTSSDSRFNGLGITELGFQLPIEVVLTQNTTDSLYNYDKMLKALQNGDEYYLMSIIEVERRVNMARLEEIWPKKIAIPEWAKTPIVEIDSAHPFFEIYR